jgi:hypothetical protein
MDWFYINVEKKLLIDATFQLHETHTAPPLLFVETIVKSLS